MEYLREIIIKDGSLIVSDARCDDWNYTDTSFRHSLEDLINYVIKTDMDALCWNREKNCYENKHIKCAKCSSKRVTIPYCKVDLQKYKSLEEELKENNNEYQNLRRERNGTNLPVLWQPE